MKLPAIPINALERQAALKSLKILDTEPEERDALTGLYNRRYLK